MLASFLEQERLTDKEIDALERLLKEKRGGK
jgi:hypothetical protein